MAKCNLSKVKFKTMLLARSALQKDYAGEVSDTMQC